MTDALRFTGFSLGFLTGYALLFFFLALGFLLGTANLLGRTYDAGRGLRSLTGTTLLALAFGLLEGAEEVTIRVVFAAGTVDVTLGHQTQQGVHLAIVDVDFRHSARDGAHDKLGNTDLLDMRVVLEGLFYILHVGAATCQDETSQQFVAVFFRYLIPDVGDNFLHAAFDNLNEFASLYGAVGIHRILHVVVNLIVIRIGAAVLQHHLLSIALFHL